MTCVSMHRFFWRIAWSLLSYFVAKLCDFFSHLLQVAPLPDLVPVSGISCHTAFTGDTSSNGLPSDLVISKLIHTPGFPALIANPASVPSDHHLCHIRSRNDPLVGCFPSLSRELLIPPPSVLTTTGEIFPPFSSACVLMDTDARLLRNVCSSASQRQAVLGAPTNSAPVSPPLIPPNETRLNAAVSGCMSVPTRRCAAPLSPSFGTPNGRIGAQFVPDTVVCVPLHIP